MYLVVIEITATIHVITVTSLHPTALAAYCAVCSLLISADSRFSAEVEVRLRVVGRGLRGSMRVELFEIFLAVQLFCCKGSLIKDQDWAGPACLGKWRPGL